MESLLRLSGKSRVVAVFQIFYNNCITNATEGLLGDDDESTDLATLEKRLSEKHQQSRQASQALTSNPTSPSQATSGHDGTVSTPRSSITSPEPSREKDFRKDHSPQPEKPKDEEEVEALSEMMCSLVTNQSGETRYIGKCLQATTQASRLAACPGAYPLTSRQDPLPDSLYSHQRVYSG